MLQKDDPNPDHTPLSAAALVGRTEAVRDIRALLGQQAVRLLTLIGTGGVGKTVLAVAAAPDSVFVPLAPVRDPAFVVSAIAQAFGVRERDGQPLLEQLVVHLRDTATLLLLDNFEHVMPAASDIAALLAGCPALTILVTSRAPLHLADEHLYDVPPLALPNAGALPPMPALRQFAALALFVQRAQAVQPDFGLTATNAAIVADICRLLGGLPLAIELAAVRLRVLTLPQIKDRLHSRLALLTGGSPAAPTRHRTLRDTIAWSYDLLAADEQRLFARLAVFAGGWTADAVEAVCAGDPPVDVLNGLTSLLDKNLIRRTPDTTDESRFQMLETIREYAAEMLAKSGEEKAVRQRHVQYFTTLAERTDPHLRSPQQAIWLARLQNEQNNIRAALEWNCTPAVFTASPDLAIRLAAALWFFWTLQSQLNEARRWIDAVLAYPPA